MQMQTLIPSQKVWVYRDSIYEPGTIISNNPQSEEVQIKLERSNQTFSFPSKYCSPRAYEFKDYEDMCSMEILNQPEIIHNLLFRYQHNRIYTNIGSTLVAINPYQSLPALYQQEALTRIRNKVLGSEGLDGLQPHVYVTAGNAFITLRESGRKQAIIISGESGAGKTENTKYCMKFITTLSHKGRRDPASKPIEEIILESNPILECFGNSKTVKNNNSSRFGKFIKLFMKSGTITGARIQNYLLEKSRVTSVAKKQRTFHVFYFITHKSCRKDLGLLEGESFDYLEGGAMTAEGIDDKEGFLVLKGALKNIGLKQQEIKKIFVVLAGILLIGNLNFSDKENSKNPNVNCAYQSKELVERISKSLEIKSKEIDDVLLEQKRQIGKETMIKRYSKQQCVANRNTLSKALYGRVFDYLVNKINQRLWREEQEDSSIGILDIFGFQMFDHNSFQQLCINFTNEKLQKLYTKYIFESEIEELKKDGLGDKLKAISPPDNKNVIELIEKRVGVSIFSLIDQKTILGAAKDEDIVLELRKMKNKSLYVDAEPNKSTFIVLHTQSPVVYNVSEFKSKNQDSVTPEIQEIVDRLFPLNSNNDEKGKTLVTKFDKQLRTLNQELQASSLHFIRCIKPNHTKQPLKLDQKYALEQIRYMGILEAIKIRKNTFSFRLFYSTFLSNYKCLVGVDKSFSKLSLTEQCMGILRRVFPGIQKDKDGYQLGKEKIYLNEQYEGRLNQLVVKEYERKNKATLVIQRTVRRFRERTWLVKGLKLFLQKARVLRKICQGKVKRVKQYYFQRLRQRAVERGKGKNLERLQSQWRKVEPILRKYQRFLFFMKLKFSTKQQMYQTITQYATYLPADPIPQPPKKEVVESILVTPNNYQTVILPPANIKADIAFKGEICISPYNPDRCNIQRLFGYITHLVVYKGEEKEPWMSVDVDYSISKNLRKSTRSKLQNFIYMDFYESTLRKKRTVFGKYKKVAENLQYKGDPMKSSLLVLHPDQEKVALDIFKRIIAIGEEHKLSKICESIQIIIGSIKGKSQTLKDEVFLQLLKQQNHTNEYSVIKMYQLTTILLYCEVISKDHLLAGLSCYLERLENQEIPLKIKEYITQTFPRLLREYESKGRQQITSFPAKYQIMALMSRRQISVSIFLSVGQQLVIFVESFETFKDIKERVCLKAGINPERFISEILTFIELINYENMDMKENPIDENRRVWDLLTEWETAFTQYEDTGQKPPVFIIMMKLRYDFQLHPNDIEGIQLVYAQCYFDLFLGKLTIPLHLQHQNSAIMKVVQPQTSLQNIIPLIHTKDQKSKQEYIDAVSALIPKLSHKGRSELRFKFIKNCEVDSLCMSSCYSTDCAIKIYLKLRKIILVHDNGVREDIRIRRVARWSIEGYSFSLIVNEEKGKEGEEKEGKRERTVNIRMKEEYGRILSDNLTSNMKLIMQLQGVE